MEVPVGFLAKLCSFLSFLPFFLMILTLGLVKAAVVGPIAAGIIVISNSSVVIGMWIAHFLWTYYCVARTQRIGLILKMVVLVLLPVPLILWPIVGIIGSILGGVGYGFLAPLVGTFEAVGDNVEDKFYRCFLDGCLSTIEGSFTAVRDFTDFCFHSYFSYMDELIENVPLGEKPLELKLLLLPSCLLVMLVAVPIDMVLITAIAMWKSPYMLFLGWKRLFEDLVGREGPFLETFCVPFAGLIIIIWPLAVIGSVVAAFVSSLFLGLYSGVIVHQEGSLSMGLAYVLAVVSLFDEYVNDMLYLREGSCLPRPIFRKDQRSQMEGKRNDLSNKRTESLNLRPILEKSRTLKLTIHHYKPVKVWDWLFKSCEENGRILLRENLINNEDMKEYVLKGHSKKLTIKLPALTILNCLLASAKSNSSGLVIGGVELTLCNAPRDKVLDWCVGPLLILKEQLAKLQLTEQEENCIKRLLITHESKLLEDWDDSCFSAEDNVRRAQLQAILRRLQGIVASISRIPTFRRRLRNMVKALAIEAIKADVIDNQVLVTTELGQV